MTFIETIERSPFLISDGGIETRIAYETDIPLDPEMGVARLVEEERGRPEDQRRPPEVHPSGRVHPREVEAEPARGEEREPHAGGDFRPSLLMLDRCEPDPHERAPHAGDLCGGRAVAQGNVDDVLTSANLTAAFGLDLEVRKEDGRFTCRAR